MLQPHMIQTSRKTFKKHLTHLLLRVNIQSQQTNKHNKTEENKMSIFEIIAEETVKRFGHDDEAYKVYQDGVRQQEKGEYRQDCCRKRACMLHLGYDD